MATAVQDTSLEFTALYHQLDSYPWHEDQEFQGGLSAILGSVQNPGQVEHLTLRAKCYYFARKAGTQVDFDGYKRWTESQRDGGATNGVESSFAPVIQSDLPVESDAGAGGMANAPKPASFAELCELIAEGKPIPGIKDIPDTILEGQSSESQATQRKKPWEKSSAASETPSWMA